jgi:predicted nucleic acid-binding protein
MLVVSNTSPLSNLAIVGRLHLLSDRYATVTIPSMVRQELNALAHAEGRLAINDAVERGWLVVEDLPESLDLSAYLEFADPGECEAIALAELKRADKILLDDRAGRELARERGLKVVGVLGELLYAKQVGRIASVRGEMEKLQTEARFFVHADLKALILAEAGEQ